MKLMMRCRVLGKLFDEGDVIRLRRDVRGDGAAHTHRRGVIARGVMQRAMVDRPEIGMRQIQQVHGRALQIFHRQRHVEKR